MKPLETVPTTGVQRPGLSACKGPWTVHVLWLHDFETGGSPVLLSWKLKQFIFRIEEPEIPQMRGAQLAIGIHFGSARIKQTSQTASAATGSALSI
ncbi:Pro-Epidermal Growth Factor [Manis pentadactyla]|nr:Pro-Epidermal Growth Factor [Manis pentadactyla]